MKTKAEILKQLGIAQEYNAHGGLSPDTKEVILIEVLIDIGDILYSSLDSDQAARLLRLKNP